MEKLLVNIKLLTTVIVTILFIGVHCEQYGYYLAPIELVRETGCLDSEIRLVCPKLDTTVAILKATFTPNCTLSSRKECSQLDLKRLTRAYSTPSLRQRLEEKEAGRIFLETLRKRTEEEEDMESIAERYNARFGANYNFVAVKQKRNSLRSSLEQLLVEYLRNISPNSNIERKKRSIDDTTEAMEDGITTGPFETTTPLTNSNGEPTKTDRYMKVIEERGNCTIRDSQVGHLDRTSMDAALKNYTSDEYNIRMILNHKCSGKNLCTFLFAVDHPLSLLWDSGTIRITYVCMDAFRVNRYCGEHLAIGNEIAANRQIALAQKRHEKRRAEEPRAEARTQEGHHQFTNVKILKIDEEPKEDTRKQPDHAHRRKHQHGRKNPNGVFSKDFRILKVLPSELDEVNDITKIGDKYYFKKDDPITWEETEETVDGEKRNVTEIPAGQKHHKIIPLPAEPKPTDDYEHNIIDLQQELEDSFPTIPSKYDFDEEMQLLTKRIAEKPTTPKSTTIHSESTTGTTHQPTTIDFTKGPNSKVTDSDDEMATDGSETTQIWDDDQFKNNRNIFESLADYDKENDEFATDFEYNDNDEETNGTYGQVDVKKTTDTINKIDFDKKFKHPSEKLIYDENSVITDEGDDEDDYEYEDYKIVYDGSKVSRHYKKRIHVSYQLAAMHEPLLQGFIQSPGWPDHYIGDSECKWKISAPLGQKIRLTFIDINLRQNDSVCRDYVQVVDLESSRLLFNSCSEYIPKPKQIISNSNHIEVIFKTTSKVVYPKRGVLLHYAAFGCTLPPTPINGRLVHAKENRVAKYACDSGFVFPDSGSVHRELNCLFSHTWDKILPDCIEAIAVAGSGIVSHWNQHKTESAKMSDKTADMTYDIVLPSLLIAGLFIVNTIVFLIIMRYRNRSNPNDENARELANL